MSVNGSSECLLLVERRTYWHQLTVALLLWWVALLTRVLLLRWVPLLLRRALLVCFLLLAVLGVT